MNKSSVISQVVDNDLCIGCGACTYACDSNALSMHWNDYGFLVPELTDTCDCNDACINVCPFNPSPKPEVKNESKIANIFLSESTVEIDKLGRLINVYAGHSHEFRETSSSGGIATYILNELLQKGIVDHIFSVTSEDQGNSHYQYSVISSTNELKKSSKTKYYPVTLESVLSKLDKLDGTVAVVGVACFVKAIRLAQYENPVLKEKIPFIVGIICGGVKSRYFTEYLASKAGIENSNNIQNPQYRIKDENSTAHDYSFGALDMNSNSYKKIKMREVGDMWGTGLFKANACDFCDDVVTELADISLGDAWLEPYNLDGRGTSLIITRSPLAESIIKEGISNSRLTVNSITPETMKASQQGSYNHRHEGLYVRIKEAKIKGWPIAEKRYGKAPVPPHIAIVQLLRRRTRKKSLEIWNKRKSSIYFDKEIAKDLRFLKLATKYTRYHRGIMRRLKGLVK